MTADGGTLRQGRGGGWTEALRRLRAVTIKEFIQMRRDRLTFAMMVGVPVMQLLLFGYAINTDPKDLPTAVLTADQSVYGRSILAALQNTGYFEVTHVPRTEAELDRLLQAGRVQFGVQIPAGFARALQRGERPAVLVVADATDPAATGNAVAALDRLLATALRRDLRGPAWEFEPQSAPFEIIVHRRYNPAGDTQVNIVPGLLGVVLTLSMLLFTALAVTREVERGTMESLLAMPVRPVEVMLGKIVPYVLVGFVQTALILAAALLLFDVPMRGSLALLLGLTTLFIVATLSVGYTFSTIAKNQLQAVQMSFFFFLPNLLLSGFMFPFRGMPEWAQWLGEVLPLTHFVRVVRGVMLKGSGVDDMVPDVAGLLAFMAIAMLIALIRFRRTLD
jgi:ABC-2 type transport system permease protein